MPYKFNPITGNLDLVNTASVGAGTGDVVGPSASTNNNFAIFSGTTGKLLEDTNVRGTDFQSVTADNINYATATHTTISATTVTATSLASLNISTTNLESSTITATSLASLNLSSTNISSTLVTSTNLISSNLLSITLTTTNLQSVTITATSLASLNLSTTNLQASSVTATNVGGGTATFTTVTTTNLGALNCSTTNLQATTATATTVTATNLNGQTATLTTVTASNIGSATLSSTNITTTTISATNVNFSGATVQDTNIDLTADLLLHGVSFVLDGGTTTIGNGTVKGFSLIPYNATITNIYLMADQAGNIDIDLWKAPYSATNLPTNGNSIFGTTNTMSLIDSQAISLASGFTGSILANDVIRVNIDNCTTITNCTIILAMRKI